MNANRTPPRARHCTSGAAINLPLIDVAEWADGTPEQRADIAAAWDDAFTHVGFCQIKGYERILPGSAIRELREEATAFFEGLPLEAKMAAHGP